MARRRKSLNTRKPITRPKIRTTRGGGAHRGGGLTGSQHYDCSRKSYQECYNYLSSAIGRHSYRRTFNRWFHNLGMMNYQLLQIGQFDWRHWIDEQDELMGPFCSCDCHGFGGCSGGSWCCGFGGLGICCQKNGLD